jgi:hypothetical protein
MEAAWKLLRRGWHVGGESFRLGLLARAKQGLLGQRRELHGGAARRAHDQAQAEWMLERGLGELGMRREALASAPKGQLEKQVLAWWLYGQTTVSRRCERRAWEWAANPA